MKILRARTRKILLSCGAGATCQRGRAVAQAPPMGTSRRKFWSAVETEYRSESIAARSVHALGFEFYNPRYRSAPVKGVRSVLPLLDRYLLVRLDHRSDWSDIHRAKGVKKLMRGPDSVPSRIEDHKIEWLRGLEDELGYVRLDSEEPPAFAFQDAVVALRGAFRDQNGEYRGIDNTNHKRALVAFEILGREIVTSQSRYDLALA